MSAPGARARGPVELTEPELVEWGREIGRVATAHAVFVCLYGALGAGKSTLARAACRGAGVSGAVPSPTFTLINRYARPDGEPVYHADLYRIDDPTALVDLGWQDLVQTASAVFLEWPERAGDHLPASRWDIQLALLPDPARRSVTATCLGDVPPLPPFSVRQEA